ncbi:hypothetical protein [Halobaculum sp. D14]|uniref:hypothetical protein n=1 Tax=unclassified Halobaculum TaxID=2640896 RepID=UPI003EB75B6A
MWVRERDVVDYLLVSAVTALAYLHLPFRPAIREWLRSTAAAVVAYIDNSPEVVVAAAVVVVAVCGAAFVAGLVRHASAS